MGPWQQYTFNKSVFFPLSSCLPLLPPFTADPWYAASTCECHPLTWSSRRCSNLWPQSKRRNLRSWYVSFLQMSPIKKHPRIQEIRWNKNIPGIHRDFSPSYKYLAFFTVRSRCPYTIISSEPFLWCGQVYTPWKINMESENHPLAKENHLPNLH